MRFATNLGFCCTDSARLIYDSLVQFGVWFCVFESSTGDCESPLQQAVMLFDAKAGSVTAAACILSSMIGSAIV